MLYKIKMENTEITPVDNPFISFFIIYTAYFIYVFGLYFVYKYTNYF